MGPLYSATFPILRTATITPRIKVSKHTHLVVDRERYLYIDVYTHHSGVAVLVVNPLLILLSYSGPICGSAPSLPVTVKKTALTLCQLYILILTVHDLTETFQHKRV